MLKLFQQAGLPRRTPPPFTRGAKPTSPNLRTVPAADQSRCGRVYSLRAKRLGQEIITLRATTGAGVREVYWFVGKSFVGKAAPGGTLAWRADAPGSFMVRAVDDQARPTPG